MFELIVSVIVQLNSNEHDFQKQLFTNILQKAVLKNFTKFKWKHLRPVAKSVKKRLQHRCFPVNFVKFLKTPFLQNISGQLLLNFFIYFTVSLPPSELIENRLFPFLNMFYYKSYLSNVMNIISFAIEKNTTLQNKRR